VEPNERVAVGDLVERIAGEAGEIEGVTISGGEPLQQAGAVLRLLSGVRESTDLSVVVFSGYELDEIEGMRLGPDILDRVDVLIAGRYEAERRLARGLRGSSNQTVYLLTDRYSLQDIERVSDAEIEIDPSGKVTVSGIDPP
jgi:anaerobic ribonucleoside-triphosphate reductase activating protein